MMTNKTAMESTKVALLLHNDAFLQDLYTLALVLHLMTEKYSKDSFWAPYINSLPRVCPPIPLVLLDPVVLTKSIRQQTHLCIGPLKRLPNLKVLCYLMKLLNIKQLLQGNTAMCISDSRYDTNRLSPTWL